MFFSRSRLGVVDHEGRCAGEGTADFSWVDDVRLANPGEFKLMIVTKADHVVAVAVRENSTDGIVVIDSEAAALEFQFGHFTMKLNMSERLSVLGDAIEIAIIVPEDDMDLL